MLFRYYPSYHGSTLPSLAQLEKRKATIFEKEDELAGIDLNVDGQLSLADEFSAFQQGYQPDKTQSVTNLYYYENDMFGYADGLVLYSFLRHFKPRNVIEIGSGFSSALMIDTCKTFELDTRLTFVDPYSTTIQSVLVRHNEQAFKTRLIREEIQNIDKTLFSQISAGDILFIDSSHALKVGSDLSSLFFDIIPNLPAGVIIHIHDIWYPFEYPYSMLMDGRVYNEAYFLRAFLQFNDSVEILFWNSYLREKQQEAMVQYLPKFLESGSCSIWLRKTA